jgi:hypothetical protein
VKKGHRRIVRGRAHGGKAKNRTRGRERGGACVLGRSPEGIKHGACTQDEFFPGLAYASVG